MLIRNLVVWICCGLLAGTCLPVAAVSAADNLDDNRRELQAIEQRIRQARDNLQLTSQAEAATQADLQSLDTDQNRLGELIVSGNQRLQLLAADLLQAGRQLEQTNTAVKILEERVRLRLAALYKRSDADLLQLVLAGESPTRLAEDFIYAGHIVRHDRELLQGYRTFLAEQKATRLRLESLSSEQQQLLEGQERERQALSEAAKVKEQLLAKIRQDRNVLAARLDALKERAGALAALIKRLESAGGERYSRKSGGFAVMQGQLPWPAHGQVRTGFGIGRHPELGSVFQSQGIELQVTAGDPVQAVWPGRVVFADHFKGYGQMLILEHGDGYYTLYAHLSRLASKVNAEVARGEILAYPGGGQGDRLYFEIRKGGTPLDPMQWLLPR